GYSRRLYSSALHDRRSKELPLARNYLGPSKVSSFWNRCLVDPGKRFREAFHSKQFLLDFRNCFLTRLSATFRLDVFTKIFKTVQRSLANPFFRNRFELFTSNVSYFRHRMPILEIESLQMLG